MSGKKWAIAGAIVVALGVVAYLIFFRGDGGIPGFIKPEPPPNAAFKTGEVRAPDAHDRPEAMQRAVETSGRVIAPLNEMYTFAFLRPDSWPGKEGETPPGDRVAGYFSLEARAGATRDLGALALADLGPRFRRVEPTRQEVPRLSFLVEQDLGMLFAVATVSFEARGETEEKAEGPVLLVHNATYFLALEGDVYRIVAYNVELKADTEARAAAYGALPKWEESSR